MSKITIAVLFGAAIAAAQTQSSFKPIRKVEGLDPTLPAFTRIDSDPTAFRVTYAPPGQPKQTIELFRLGRYWTIGTTAERPISDVSTDLLLKYRKPADPAKDQR